MTDIQTDVKTITIEIREHADVIIQNLNAPSFSYVGEEIVINYDVLNQGGEELCYCKLIRTSDEMELDRQELTLASGSTTNIEHIITEDDIGNLNLTIEVGYIE